MKHVVIAFGVMSLVAFIGGCRSLDDQTRKATKPIGTPLGFTQSVPEGVAEGYAPDPTDNPYER